MSGETMEDLKIKSAIGDHEKECREKDGPIALLRKEVGELKGWAKVLTVALMLVPLWLAIGGWALTGYIGSRIDARIDKALKISPQASAEPRVLDFQPLTAQAQVQPK